MHLTSIVMSSSSSKYASKPAPTFSSDIEVPNSGINYENSNKQAKPGTNEPELHPLLLALLGFCFLGLVSVLAFVLYNQTKACILANFNVDTDGGGNYSAAMDGDLYFGIDDGHLRLRSIAKPEDVKSRHVIPAELRAQLPPEIRNMSAVQLKQILSSMEELIKRCTVSPLNLADLSGNWMLASIAVPPPKKEVVIAKLINDKPGHLGGTLKAGQQEQILNFIQQVPEVPGFLVQTEVKSDKKIVSPLFIVVHKLNRFLVTLVIISDGMASKTDYGIYVRVPSKFIGKKPKPLTPAELEEAKAGVNCLLKGMNGGKDIPEPVFHDVL